jgi:undecaprenyl-diphosphatase
MFKPALSSIEEIDSLSFFEAVILGLAQGLSEFLPISSSGHLALLEYFFGIEGESALTFAVMLHIGTLISVFTVYWRDIAALFYELYMFVKDVFTGKGLMISANVTRKLGFLIITATIPTAIIGIAFKDLFEAMYRTLHLIGIGFLITGTILIIAERAGANKSGIIDMKFRSAFFVGICQGIAIWPGISRSGTTIFGSLICGLTRADAVKFAFLISIPTILGSALLEAPNAFKEGMDVAMFIPVVVGMAVAAISGIIAIKTMIKVVSDKKLFGFSVYTWILGAFVLMYALFFA